MDNLYVFVIKNSKGKTAILVSPKPCPLEQNEEIIAQDALKNVLEYWYENKVCIEMEIKEKV